VPCRWGRAKLTFHVLPCLFFRPEEVERLEVHHPGDEHAGEHQDLGVEIHHVPVVELAGEGYLLLRVCELILQVHEVLAGPQLGVVLGHGEEVAQGPGHHVVGFGGLLGPAGALQSSAGLCHPLEHLAFVSGVALHGLHQIGDQARSPLELHVDAGPGFVHPHTGADETVVHAGHDKPQEHDDADYDHDDDDRCQHGPSSLPSDTRSLFDAAHRIRSE
jgi:hypothetical protein